MSYMATVADALALYGEDYVVTSADRDNDGELDTASFQLALDAAENEISGWIVGRVPGLPLDPVPPQLKKYCIDIAIHTACPTADVMTEQKQKRYDAAIAYLTMVAKGQVRLVQAPLTPAATPNETLEPDIATNEDLVYEFEPHAREFSRSSLRRI